VALLRRVAEDNLYREDYHATVFIVSAKPAIPPELENLVTLFDIPLPVLDEIAAMIEKFTKEMDIAVSPGVVKDIARALTGLSDNDVAGIPPELLRKGRFDELFFVDLPNEAERRKILEIHLRKRRKWNREIDLAAVIDDTKGFNGADIEAAVKEAIEAAFIAGKEKLATADLLAAVKSIKSISASLKDKIAAIRDALGKMEIKPASETASAG
jgi:SpoVK/Ycf46/Vps4 family AAA+-type ATPase